MDFVKFFGKSEIFRCFFRKKCLSGEFTNFKALSQLKNMSLTCNFCNKTFANISSLNYHKDTSKYYFWKGQKGMASFCNDNIIKAPEKPLMSCTDTTRYRFKHLDEKGNVYIG